MCLSCVVLALLYLMVSLVKRNVLCILFWMFSIVQIKFFHNFYKLWWNVCGCGWERNTRVAGVGNNGQKFSRNVIKKTVPQRPPSTKEDSSLQASEYRTIKDTASLGIRTEHIFACTFYEFKVLFWSEQRLTFLYRPWHATPQKLLSYCPGWPFK